MKGKFERILHIKFKYFQRKNLFDRKRYPTEEGLGSILDIQSDEPWRKKEKRFTSGKSAKSK